MAYHYTSNWLGERTRERIEPDPDAELDRMLDEREAQDAIDLTITPLELLMLAELCDIDTDGAA